MIKDRKFQKDDILELTIEDMGEDGQGIGKVDNVAFFIKDALIGDTIKAKIMKMKKNYGFARLLEITKPSSFRVQPVCPISRQCGGCQLQALSYERQLQFKKDKVYHHLKRIGGFLDIKVEDTIGMEEPYHYRNKSQYPIGYDKQGNLCAGFYAARTHSLIPVAHCYIGAKENDVILKSVLSVMETYKITPYNEETNKGLLRHVLIRVAHATKEIMVCLIINGKKLPFEDKMIESLRKIEHMTSISININEEKTNVILGEKTKTIWGKDKITDRISDVKYAISPQSFYQVNSVQTKKLYDLVMDYAMLSGNEIVWDLYCGIGTISLFLAQKAKKVYGVEIVPQAIINAKENAMLNERSNIEFFTGKAEEILPMYYEKQKQTADVMVVDPPRKGCAMSLLETMIFMQPKRIVYVSCDSATLARDLKYLCENGYLISKVQPVDQFCHTGHVETVVQLIQKSEGEK